MSKASERPRGLSHAERCRTILAQAKGGTLATLAKEPSGFPYASLVNVAFDGLGSPILLLSTLAEHTGNLQERSESSLLVCEKPRGDLDPLALGRVTLMGNTTRVEGADAIEASRATYLKTHPRAADYAGFTDFGFFRLDVTSVRYVGGFGRMSWVDAEEYRNATADPLVELAASILEHMNADHADSVLLFAKKLLHMDEALSAAMTSVDRYGFDLTAITQNGPRSGRIAFDTLATSSDSVRKLMIELVRTARTVR